MQIYRHLYRTLFQILCFMDISGKKNPELQENILLRIPVLLTWAQDLESHVRERYFKKIYVVGVDPVAIRSEHWIQLRMSVSDRSLEPSF